MSLPDRDENANTSPAVEFLKALFGNTEQAIFLQTLANDPADQDEAPNKRHLISRDIAAIERFVHKHDRARRGMFVCVGTVNPNARQRSKDVIAEAVGLHTDLDFKGIAETEPAIWEVLERLEARPTVAVRSGGGVHLYWLFREPVDAQALRQRLEVALKALAEVLAGDVAVCEISRLMRLPGSHNSKYGDLREVVVEWSDGPRYELEGLEEWLEYQRPLLSRKALVAASNGTEKINMADTAANPYLALAAQFGYRPRLDVDAALAEMAAGNIHDTLLRVSASMISSGRDPEEVVMVLMEASRQKGAPDWDWRAQEKEIRAMCDGALKKFPPKPQPEPDVSRETVENTVKLTVDLGEERAKRAPPRLVKGGHATGGKINHLDIGELFLAGMRTSGNLLMFTETQGSWLYQDRLWRLLDDRTMRAYLDRQIEQCIRLTPVKSKISLVNETRAWIVRHPELQVKYVAFDDHGQVPTRSGLVHPVTGVLTPPAPEQFCTWRIEAHYNPDALCLWWLTMLEDAFADRPDDVRAEYIDLIQEMLGSWLIDASKPRGLCKAFIAQGGSNAGKSGALEVMAGLFGAEHNTTALDALEGAHGLVPFARRVPWVLHEAFDQRKWHFSSIVKAMITGEPVQINIKNGPIISQRFTAPILWGANNPPQFQEASKAIVNRIVVVRFRQEFDEARPIGAAAQALKLGYSRPSELVLGLEMTGLLAWAVAGLRRALARGCFLQPAEVLEVAHEIRLDSNLVAGFVEDCVAFDPDMRVSSVDFCSSFSAWWVEHKGENRSMPSNESIGRALAALGDERIAVNRKELRVNSRRYYAGIRLNEDGLHYHGIAVDSDVFKGKTTSATAKDGLVNSPIPGAWDVKDSVFAMRLAHRKRRVRGVTDAPF